jgi:PAS domain S-box-containing protein
MVGDENRGINFSIIDDNKDAITARDHSGVPIDSSDSKYHGLFDSMSEAFQQIELIMSWDGKVLDYRFIEVNRAFEKLIGKIREDIVGRLASELFKEIDIDLREVFEEVARTGEPSHFQSIGTESGRYYEVNVWRPASGQCAVLYTDITDRYRVEERLRSSEEKFRILHDTMLQGVVYQDHDGKIISYNPSAAKILGWGHEKHLDRSSVTQESVCIREDGSLFPGMEHPAMVALRTGKEVRDVIMGVFNPISESYRWIVISAVPLFRPGKAGPDQVYTIFYDITERRMLEEALKFSQRRKALLADISHQLVCVEDPRTIIKDIGQKITQFLDWDVFFNFMVEDGKHKAHLNAYSGIPEIEANKI